MRTWSKLSRCVALSVLICAAHGFAQEQRPARQPAQTLPAQTQPAQDQPARTASPVVNLYRQLRTVGLDPTKVYRVREVALDREDLHVYFNDGVIAFTTAIDGRITGGYFEGDGEILLRPPDATERMSLGLFTGLGVLNEAFRSAYLRFNDDTFQSFVASGYPAENAAEFVASRNEIATALASMDALRLLGTFTTERDALRTPDQFLHLRLASDRLQNFDVVYDTLAFEEHLVGGLTTGESGASYDIWMSFPSRRTRSMTEKQRAQRLIDPWRSPFAVTVTSTKVSSRLIPPETIDATADVTVKVASGGQRVLTFELSRYLQVRSVQLGGTQLDFIQNEAMTGSDLAKRGNDLVTVVLPAPLTTGEQLTLQFAYTGRVMQQAGPGLLYVGARGTWYPNRGIGMTNFDLRFRWPAEWTLVATGRRVGLAKDGEELVGHWVSDGTIPIAGFNLGQYTRSSARAGNIPVESYATAVVEQALRPRAPSSPQQQRPSRESDIVVVSPPDVLNPAQGAQSVADVAARALTQFSEWFGPYPYSSLSLTQFPGNMSQGWPTMIFLASSSFLTAEERARLKMTPFEQVLFGEAMQAHETAHQWWGDLVGWRSYREQWLSEALANYSALMIVEQTRPQDAKLMLDEYANFLSLPNAAGKRYVEAGPVSLGYRLSSSVFPAGYVSVSYGRGTWLMHMLRCLFRDAARSTGNAKDGDARFIAALRSIREKHERKEISVDDVQRAFEAYMPDGAAYEKPRSLDWFFDGWVNGAAMPKLRLESVKISSKGAQSVATFTILQEEAPETLVTSVPIYAVAQGSELPVYAGRVFADGRETRGRINVPAGTRRLVIDADHSLLISRD